MRTSGSARLRGGLLAIALAVVTTTPAACRPTAAPARPAAAPTPCAVLAAAGRADRYWTAHGSDQADGGWRNATFNVAHLRLAALTGAADRSSLAWARGLGWQVGAVRDVSFPDNFAAGEAYLDLARAHAGGVELAPLRARVQALVAAGDPGVDDYVDALNMNLPAVARLGVMDGSQADLAFVRAAYTGAERTLGLFDPAAGLWWRDRRFVHTGVYWSRGNGWAMAATAKLLAALPAGDPLRPELVAVLRAMAAALRPAQRADGAWGADLLDPAHVPGPESSGTGFLTFAIAWGVDSGVLDAATYAPVVQAAWRWLSGTALRADGLVGFVQPEDSQPAATTAGTTRAYGAGALVLAATEVARLTPGCRVSEVS